MKIFLISILTNLLFSGIFCQTIDETFQFANDQLQNGNYENAISAYRRVLYFDDQIYNTKVYANLSKCYELIHDYNKSHYYLDLAYSNTKNDSIKNVYVIKKTYLYILQKKFDYAMIEITNVKHGNSNYFKKEVNFYKGIIFFQKNDFEKAEQSFINCFDKKEKNKIEKVDSLFRINNKLEKLNPKAVRHLSIIPGLGQLYAGYPKEALNSFILATALLSLYTYTIINYSVIDGFLAIIPWFQRYYVGGLEKTEQLAIEKINTERNTIYLEILSLF